jgi:hypothetical protein
MIDEEPRPNSPEDIGGPQGWTPPPPKRWAIPPSAPQRECRSCRAPIYWVVTDAGKPMPVNPDGSSHFATCAHAAEHRKPRAKVQPKLEPPALTHEQRAMLERVHDGRSLGTLTTTVLFTLDELRRLGCIARDEGGPWTTTELGVRSITYAKRFAVK